MEAPEAVIDSLSNPAGIASDEEDNLFVAETSKGCVRKLDRDGRTSIYVESGGKPTAIVIDDSGDMFVADAGRRHVLLFSPDEGVEVYANQCKGRRFAGPQCMYFSPSGEILFSDSGTDEGSEGSVYGIGLNGETTLMTDDLAGPTGLVISGDASRLYVSESRANRVVSFEIDDDGGLDDREVFVDFSDGDGVGSLVFDSEGSLLVARHGVGITTVDPDGQVVEETELQGKMVGGLCFGGMDFDLLFAAEAESGAVYRFSLNTPGQRPFAGPRSV